MALQGWADTLILKQILSYRTCHSAATSPSPPSPAHADALIYQGRPQPANPACCFGLGLKISSPQSAVLKGRKIKFLPLVPLQRDKKQKKVLGLGSGTSHVRARVGTAQADKAGFAAVYVF